MACVFALSDFLQPHGLQSTRILCPWNSPGKNTGVSFHFLLQGIFLTQGWNLSILCLLHWQAVSLPTPHLGSPFLIKETIKEILENGSLHNDLPQSPGKKKESISGIQYTNTYNKMFKSQIHMNKNKVIFPLKVLKMIS